MLEATCDESDNKRVGRVALSCLAPSVWLQLSLFVFLFFSLPLYAFLFTVFYTAFPLSLVFSLHSSSFCFALSAPLLPPSPKRITSV